MRPGEPTTKSFWLGFLKLSSESGFVGSEAGWRRLEQTEKKTVIYLLGLVVRLLREMTQQSHDGRPSEGNGDFSMKTSLLASILTIGLGTAFATTTTDEIKITNSAGTVVATISDNGACVSGVGSGCTGLTNNAGVYDLNPNNSAMFVTGTITLPNGSVWTITDTTGSSNSPSVFPYALDVGSLTSGCTSGCTAPGSELDIYYSDINFTSTVGGFTTFYSATDTGAGKTTQDAYVGTGIFDTTSLIGTVGPLTAAGGSGTASGGGAAGPAPYSLTIEDIFAASNNGATFSVDGNITAVPEPGAILLLGTVLVFCGSRLRRRVS